MSEHRAPAASAALDQGEAFREALDHARHLVPAQNPLDRFIHHNPLHAFEELPFEDAAIEAGELFGTEPFWREEAYREALERGRIHHVDIDAIVAHDVAQGPVAGVVERRDLVRALLLHPIERLGGESLAWTLTETDALRAPRPDLAPEARSSLLGEAGGDAARAVRRLWMACVERRKDLPVPTSHPRHPAVRVRDVLFRRLGRDADALVNPLMIRWSAGYLDQGVAYWPMADREKGFYQAFLEHFDHPVDLGRPWLGELRGIVAAARSSGWTSEQLAIHLLERLGHAPTTWGEVVLQTLLVLRGWSGMFQRLTDRPDTAPERMRMPTELSDVLAVRLALDTAAASWLLGAGSGSLLERARALPRPVAMEEEEDPAWTLFQLAQILGIGAHALSELSSPRLAALLTEADAVTEVQRRRMLHNAYERRFRVGILDAVGVHARRVAQVPAAPVRAQMVFCIDDREESLRRHVEEAAPWVQTLGVAGNFGIAMYYQGLEHGRPVALGPAPVTPQHLVVEVPRHGELERGRFEGVVRHQLDVGSQTLVRGALVTLGGFMATVPLALRLLAPKLHASLTRRDLPAETDLHMERTDDERTEDGLLRGFTLDEMVDIAQNTLELMSLLKDFSPLVCCMGHGSSSSNNPHKAAYDCGACGGGRGGPNARLYARIVNDPRVRARLAERGIHIPDGTWFVGGFHDTASDAVEWYDTDLVPEALQPLLAETRAVLDHARTQDAHERVRRFHSAPLEISPEAALDHVENRVEDLAQPRPEYGHCTNAICLVGRRAWSRGLFLDRRAFLCDYDPALDADGRLLAKLLGMVVPVGAGISLEYWFSCVDPTGYGCGTKLPHNISGYIGVMDGHQSDLRTGLVQQMIEIHEPIRLLCVVEATPASLLKVARESPAVGRLVTNGWVQLAALDPATGEVQLFEDGAFRPWAPESEQLPRVASSRAWYGGTRGLLPPASILPRGGEA